MPIERQAGASHRQPPPTSAMPTPSDSTPIPSAVRVPQHVVFRTFVNETVVLNLQTGIYHGLNITAGRMLDELERTCDFEATAEKLAATFEQPVDQIRSDLLAFCQDLDERGLVEIEGAR